MKKIIRTLFVLAIGTAFLAACTNGTKTPMMKNISGRPGEIVIVIAKDVWAGALGDTLFKTIGQPQLGLPAEEPLFNITQIPHEGFGEIFKTTRNLMIVNVSPETKKNEVLFQKDVYAYMQAIVTINATSQSEGLELFTKNSDKIIGYLLNAEQDRLTYNFERIYEKAVTSVTKEKFGIDIRVVPGARVTEVHEDYIGIMFDTPDITQGIFIYSFPYESDSTFTEKYLLSKRNEFMKHVVGASKGSYMTTEDVPVLFSTFKKDGNFAADIRGLFKMENDFMGGPFINLAILDLLKKRVLVLDGFVYAPNKKKRNLLRQVEAMIYSVKFENQAEIDKINKQFEL